MPLVLVDKDGNPVNGKKKTKPKKIPKKKKIPKGKTVK